MSNLVRFTSPPAPRRPRARGAGALAVGLGCLLALCPTTAARAQAYNEYQLKAVFLFNFAQFVGWPPSAFASADAPLVIGVLGRDPFGDYLDATVRNEKVNGHPLVVRRYQRVEDVGACQILFIGPVGEGMDQVLDRFKQRAILTVGDTANFARSGGMIQFLTENSKIRLLINVNAAAAAKLTISSKLLRAAELVPGGAR
ncbi:MAG TPA: YfiR family protein [Gemmatimonadaceae bacterium]|nr:YfiR family protein [Gemmatimonadaceae bacterium]